MKWLALAALLAASTAQAQQADLPDGELCVMYSLTLITGHGTAVGTQDELRQELARRGETCEPGELYMSAAQQRIANAALEIQAEADARMAQEMARQERNARIREAGRAYLQMQEQNKPRPTTTTRCTEFAGTMTCNSN